MPDYKDRLEKLIDATANLSNQTRLRKKIEADERRREAQEIAERQRNSQGETEPSE